MFLCATGTVEICVDMSFRKMLNFIAFKRFILFSVQSFNEYHFCIRFSYHSKCTSQLYACCNYVRYRGEFTIGNETYSVEPVDETLSGRHRVYRESDIIHPRLRCGVYTCLWLRVGTRYPCSGAANTAREHRCPARASL